MQNLQIRMHDLLMFNETLQVLLNYNVHRASALSLRVSALILTGLYAFADGPIRTPYHGP